MPQRTAKRLLIVGWDAADWKIIDPLFQAGALPNLRRLVDGGVRADLSSLFPMLSPLLWTSVATGKTADKHGILNFIEPDPAGPGLRPATSTTRRTKALWNILSQSDLRTLVVSWYASHPAEPIRGVCVSNLFQEGLPPAPSDPWPILPGAVHPASLTEEIASLRLHPAELRGEELLPFLPRLAEIDRADRRLALLARQVAQCASVHNVATRLIASEPWDCAMVFYETIDVVGHHFMQYHPPRMAHVPERDFDLYQFVLRGAYQLQDMMLGALLDLAGPETTVILLSDHGFHSDHLRPKAQPSPDDVHAAMDANWHRPLGILAMAGPGLKRSATIYGANLLDIAPTALTLLGLPVGADMDGRVLVEAFEQLPEIDRVFSWDTLDGDAGQHPPDRRQDPFEARDAMRQLADLGYIDPIGGDAEALLAATERETRFNLGVVHMTSRRPAEAIDLFDRLRREYPDDPRFAMNYAHCCHVLGRHADAAAVLSGFVQRHPGVVDAQILRAAALLAAGRVDEAARVLEEAERSSPDRPDLLCTLGESYTHLKRFDDAERMLGRALALDPHDARVHYALACLALSRERFEEAVEHALRAVELRHFFPEAHYTMGVALTWMKDYDHAIKAFQVALSMQPGMIDAHRFIASIYRHLDDRRSARPYRDAAERLLKARQSGQAAPDELVQAPPLGPQEWARRLGVATDDDTHD